MARINAAVIGLGIGYQHATFLHQFADTRLVAIADENPERLRQGQNDFPDSAIYDDGNHLIRDLKPDLVVIASRDSDHYGHLRTAFDAGCHIFCEKPLVMRQDHATDIFALAAEKPDILIGCNLLLRCAPRFQALRDHIQQGMLGRPYAIEASYDYGRLHKITDGWRGLDPDYSITLGGGIHILDLILWLTADRPVSVRASGNNLCMPGRSPQSGFQGPDFVTAQIRFKTGMIANVSSNFGCVSPHAHRLSIHGVQGSFINSYDRPVITTRGQEGPESLIEHLLDPAWIPKWGLLADFVNTLLNGQAERNRQKTIDALSAALNLAFAIDEAQKTGQEITI